MNGELSDVGSTILRRMYDERMADASGHSSLPALAHALGVETATLGQHMDTLDAQGYVEVHPDGKQAIITAKGEDAVVSPAERETRQALRAKIMDVLSAQEARQPGRPIDVADIAAQCNTDLNTLWIEVDYLDQRGQVEIPSRSGMQAHVRLLSPQQERSTPRARFGSTGVTFATPHTSPAGKP